MSMSKKMGLHIFPTQSYNSMNASRKDLSLCKTRPDMINNEESPSLTTDGE